MKKNLLGTAITLALLLSGCTTVTPAYKDIGSRSAPCIEGGPDAVAQKFYDLRIQNKQTGLPNSNQLAQYRPYLSTALYQALLNAQHEPKIDLAATPNEKHDAVGGDVFSSLFQGPTSVSVHSASTIPNTDARNIPLRVNMTNDGTQSKQPKWQDEVLMVREGHCWAIDDVRYMADLDFVSGGTLRQVLENR
ncbi:lipoprotein [Rouxiella sp. Mn2063]|uniref:lipoprotein n=1 Tax=Rouxiella sp. Mn2063 TaxID=3395262 RepID=UPI003BE01211